MKNICDIKISNKYQNGIASKSLKKLINEWSYQEILIYKVYLAKELEQI